MQADVIHLDPQTCERARLSRDARFDGRFFIGVLTTGIYCRPICPARSPKEENIRYFPSAAAAAETGLRPCLRCRPECSPGAPAWIGTSVSVTRALRLIAEGALTDGSVEDLAERLGMGSRHLRRLFLQHLGATPVAVVQTQRLHFAKKLIDETSVPFTQIALASGYGSVRRFNATFQQLYRRSPTELRRNSARAGIKNSGLYRFRLHYRNPFDWDGLLAFLAPRAIPGVESVDFESYRRTIVLNGISGHVDVRRDGRDGSLLLQVDFPDPRALMIIVERVKRLFDLNADPTEIQSLLMQDPMLTKRIAARPGLRVPGAWDGFELAVRAILGQQVTVKAATTLSGRLVQAFGQTVEGLGKLTHLFPTPKALVAADYSRVGIPAARAEAIRQLARAVEIGDITFSGTVDLPRFVEQFCKLRGIGDWTAQYVAMRALGEPDAFPSSDLRLLRACGIKSAKALESRARAWQPWRAYAAMHLWQGEKNGDKDELHIHREPDRATVACGG